MENYLESSSSQIFFKIDRKNLVDWNAGRLISESMDRKLSLKERFELKFHLMMCKIGGQLKKQIHFIQAVARRLWDSLDFENSLAARNLPGKSARRIQDALEKIRDG